MNTKETKLFKDALNLMEECLTFAKASKADKGALKLLKKNYTGLIKRYLKLIKKETYGKG